MAPLWCCAVPAHTGDGRKELGLPHLLVEDRGQIVVLVGLSFTSKEQELLHGRVGWRRRKNIFLRQELVGKETVLVLGREEWFL